MTERKRQWGDCEAFKLINHKLAFVTSNTQAAADGRFMEENFSARRHDTNTIDISKLKVKISIK